MAWVPRAQATGPSCSWIQYRRISKEDENAAGTTIPVAAEQRSENENAAGTTIPVAAEQVQ